MPPHRAYLLLLLAGPTACGRSGPAPEADRLVRIPALERFDSAFALVDSIVLEQRPESPIVRVSGLARRPDGTLALADASEGNVKLFAADGRLLRTLGRKGQGPGEFLAPRYPAFDPAGRLLVPDAQLGRVSVFAPDGHLERTFALEAGFPVMGFHRLPDGRFAVAALDAAADRIVHLTDSAGRSVGGFLSTRRARPRSAPDLDQWKYLLAAFVAGRGHEVVVTSTLSDSVWFVDTRDSSFRALRLDLPGYVPPSPPKGAIRSARQITEWSHAFHTTAMPFVSERLVLIPFVMGVLNYGDPTILAAQIAGGGWHAYAGAPPPVLVSGDTVFTLLHTQESARMVLGLHRAR